MHHRFRWVTKRQGVSVWRKKKRTHYLVASGLPANAQWSLTKLQGVLLKQYWKLHSIRCNYGRLIISPESRASLPDILTSISTLAKSSSMQKKSKRTLCFWARLHVTLNLVGTYMTITVIGFNLFKQDHPKHCSRIPSQVKMLARLVVGRVKNLHRIVLPLAAWDSCWHGSFLALTKHIGPH